MLLRKLAIDLEIEQEQRSILARTSFGDPTKVNNRISLNVNSISGRKQNSYVRVLCIYEYRVILFTALLQQTASTMLEISYLARVDFGTGAFINYGAIAALCTLGLYTDLLAQRNLYTLLATVIVVQILFILTQTIFEICTNSVTLFLNEKFAAFLAGYFYSLTTVLLLQQIPLYIAGRYRDLNSVWELPLAGQILGIA